MSSHIHHDTKIIIICETYSHFSRNTKFLKVKAHLSIRTRTRRFYFTRVVSRESCNAFTGVHVHYGAKSWQNVSFFSISVAATSSIWLCKLQWFLLAAQILWLYHLRRDSRRFIALVVLLTSMAYSQDGELFQNF